MATTETLKDFYQQKLNWLPENLGLDIGHFNVFRHKDLAAMRSMPIKYTRRDFYKISLMRGKSIFHYADKSVQIDGTTLIFLNPVVPYTFESLSDDKSGYFCLFTDGFFSEKLRDNIRDLPMYVAGGKPSYSLDRTHDEYVTQVFEKMLAEIGSDYRYKYDLLRNYVTELIHYALKIEPSETIYQHPDANSRITAVFTELLERQFPIESPSQRFALRSAKDFARRLSIHVNHLNRAIRTTTGKTTTEHICERLTSEAKALLKHTNWNVAEISHTLGFEHPAHFNNFFKKQTSLTPSAYRIA
jgi:AraC family transcriptional activator of pobA